MELHYLRESSTHWGINHWMLPVSPAKKTQSPCFLFSPCVHRTLDGLKSRITHTHTHPLRFSISQAVAQWSGAFFVQFNLTSLLNHLHYLTAFSQRELQTLSLCNFDESVHTEIKPGKSLILSGEKCLFAHTAAHNKMAASRAQTQRELSIKVKQ